MNYMTTASFLNFLSAKYPGGLKEFKREGGVITAIPDPSTDIIISHPGLPESIERDLREMQEENVGSKGIYPIISKKFNFEEGQNISSLLHDFTEKIKEIDKDILITHNIAVLVIEAQHIKSNSNKAERILKAIEKLNLHITYVVYSDYVEAIRN